MDSSTSHESNSGPSTSSGKGMLKRMGRVHSDEVAEPQESPQPQGEVIGAGLPLLQRLLLLKAKEDKEEKDKPKEDQVLILNAKLQDFIHIYFNFHDFVFYWSICQLRTSCI